MDQKEHDRKYDALMAEYDALMTEYTAKIKQLESEFRAVKVSIIRNAAESIEAIDVVYRKQMKPIYDEFEQKRHGLLRQLDV